MILSRDLHASRFDILDRLVGATMTELELVGLPAQGQPHDLMAEADAEQGDFAEQPPHRVDGIAERGRISRSVGKKHSIRTEGQDVFNAGFRRNDPDIAAGTSQAGEDRPLDAEIVGHDSKAL